jgi:hypothetical protein
LSSEFDLPTGLLFEGKERTTPNCVLGQGDLRNGCRKTVIVSDLPAPALSHKKENYIEAVMETG